MSQSQWHGSNMLPASLTGEQIANEPYNWRVDSMNCFNDWLAWGRFLLERGIPRPCPPDLRSQLIKEFLDEVRR